MNDIKIDKSLKIKTTGRDDTDSNFENFPYEPTNYVILERLANTGYFRKKNNLVDYGCGKGRVSFYLSFQTGCKAIGIEYNKRIYDKAVLNLDTALSKNKVSFININALDYNVEDFSDRFYFFNPFNVEILEVVINNIKKSYDNNKREILLFFYYTSERYKLLLNSTSYLTLIEDIDCTDLFLTYDEKEHILVYKMS